MWVDDELGANTESWFLARTFKMIRSDHGIRLIQSFADGRLGVGTIYQATNFGYYGHHRTRFYRHRGTGEVFHETQFSNTASPAGMVYRNRLLVDGALDTFTVRTYRYLKPLDRDARRRIRLKPRPYPKDRVGEIADFGYEPPWTQIARCAALCRAARRPDQAAVFARYLRERTDTADELVAAAADNPWVRRYEQRINNGDKRGVLPESA